MTGIFELAFISTAPRQRAYDAIRPRIGKPNSAGEAG